MAAATYPLFELDPVPDLINPNVQMLDFLDFGDESAAESSPKTVSDNHTPSPGPYVPTPPSYDMNDLLFDFGEDKKASFGGPATMGEIKVKEEPMEAPHPAPQPLASASTLPSTLPPSQQEALQQLLASFMTYQQQFGVDVSSGAINPNLLTAPSAGPSSPSNPTPSSTAPTASAPDSMEADEPLVSISELASPGPSRSRADSTFSMNDNIEERIDKLTPLSSIFSAGRGKGGKKGGGMSSVVRGDDEILDDDDSWRPSPEEYKKLSSKEKRQLRNKLSARAFRTRRKDYIGTLESHIKDRDTVIDAIRAELSQTRAENQDLRRELEALKANTMNVLHPESAEVGQSPAMLKALVQTNVAPTQRRTTTPTVNTRKDVAAFDTNRGFWGGSDMFGGSTICHTALTPELTLPAQPNLNPLLNAREADKPAPAAELDGTFSDWAEATPFNYRSMDAYRMQMWSRLSREAAADKAGVAPELRPKFFLDPSKKDEKDAKQVPALAALATAATEHIASRLSSAFWSAFAGPSALDSDKLAAVVSGKARLAVVPRATTSTATSTSAATQTSTADDLARAMAGLKVAAGTSSSEMRVRENPLGALGGFFKHPMSAWA